MAAIGESIFVKDLGNDDDSDIWDDSALISAYDNAVSIMKAKLSETGATTSYTEESTVKKNSKKKKKKNKNKNKCQWKPKDHCRVVYTEDGEVYEAVILSINHATSQCSVRFLGYGNEEEHDLLDLLPSEAVKRESVSDTQSENEIGTETREQEKNQQQKGSRRSSLGSSRGGRGRPRLPRGPPHGSSFGNFPGFPNPPMNWPMMPPPPISMPPNQPPWVSNSHPHFPSTNPFMPPVFPPMGRVPECSKEEKTIPHMPPPPTVTDDAEDLLDKDKGALHSMLMSWYMSGYHTGYYQGLKETKKSQNKGTTNEPTEKQSERTS